jgi:hypothetical protein
VRRDRLQDLYVGRAERERVAEPVHHLQRADGGLAGPERHHDDVLTAGLAQRVPQVHGLVELRADRHGVLARERPLPDLGRRRGDVQEAGVVDPGGKQHLRVAPLGGQPQRGVLGAHQPAHPAEQDVGQAAVVAVFPDREREFVHIGEGPVLPEETGERPEQQHQRGDQDGEQHGGPRRRHHGDQEHQSDGDVDGRGGDRRQAGPERFLAGMAALQ